MNLRLVFASPAKRWRLTQKKNIEQQFRYSSRTFVMVCHQTTCLSSGKNHIFINSYQNYKNFVKDPKILIVKVNFQCWKLVKSFWNYFRIYLIRWPTYTFERFWKHWFLKYIIFKKKWLSFVGSVHNFGKR